MLAANYLQMMTMTQYKNIAILSTYIISLLPKIFHGTKEMVYISLFNDKISRLDSAVYYYSLAISFLILAYCLHYPRGLDKRVTRLILTITSLDLLHLILLAKQGYGVEKIGLAILIVISYDLYNKRYGNN